MSDELAKAYRDKAAECLAIATQTADPIERIELLQIAQGYFRLADHIAASIARQSLLPSAAEPVADG